MATFPPGGAAVSTVASTRSLTTIKCQRDYKPPASYPLYLMATSCPNPVSRFEFKRIDPGIASLLANQLVASDSERAPDHCQSAAVTPSVNLSFSFLSRVSRHLIDLIAIYGQQQSV